MDQFVNKNLRGKLLLTGYIKNGNFEGRLDHVLSPSLSLMKIEVGELREWDTRFDFVITLESWRSFEG